MSEESVREVVESVLLFLKEEGLNNQERGLVFRSLVKLVDESPLSFELLIREEALKLGEKLDFGFLEENYLI